MNANAAMLRWCGACGITLAVTQSVGLILHGSIPMTAPEGLAFVRNHIAWAPTHILIIASYLLVVGFYVGLARSFVRSDAVAIAIGRQIVLVGVVLGMTHFTLHLGVYPSLAVRYPTAAAPMAARVAILFLTIHHYAHALRIAQAVVLMSSTLLFAAVMLSERAYPKWVAILGLVSASLTIACVAAAALFLSTRVGDIVFAVGLLPALAWVAISGVFMIRMAKTTSPSP